MCVTDSDSLHIIIYTNIDDDSDLIRSDMHTGDLDYEIDKLLYTCRCNSSNYYT